VSEPNVHSIDVADYQPRDLSQIIAAYQAKHVVVHLYIPGEGKGPQYSQAQLQSTLDNGCTPGGYVFCYRPTDSAERLLFNALEICAGMNIQLPCMWVDAEPSVYGPGPDEGWLDRWFGLCDSLQTPSGIYCNIDWLSTHPYMPKYANRPLWLAYWDGIADVTQGPVPHGWAELAGKQWEVAHGSLGEIDRDVFREEWTVYSAPEQPDPCADLKAENDRLRAGIDEAIAMLTQLKGPA